VIKKQSLKKIVLIILISSFLPNFLFAKEIDPSKYIQLPNEDDFNITGTIPQQVTNSWIDSTAKAEENPEKEAILFIIRKAVRKRMVE